MKKFFSAVVCVLVCFLVGLFPRSGSAEIPISVLLDGVPIENTNPLLFEDRVMVSVRALAEQLGFEVTWDEATRSVNLSSKCDVADLASYLNPDEKLAFELVNAEREALEVSRLRLDRKLCEQARLKAQDMIDNNYFAHQSPTYGYVDEMLKKAGISPLSSGENICMHAPTVEIAHKALMDSPSHRDLILREDFDDIGVAVVRGPSGGGLWTVHIFAGNTATVRYVPVSPK